MYLFAELRRVLQTTLKIHKNYYKVMFLRLFDQNYKITKPRLMKILNNEHMKFEHGRNEKSIT